MSNAINLPRRGFLGAAAVTLAAGSLGLARAARAQAGVSPADALPTIAPGTHTGFAAIRQIDAGVLNVGYAEAGPADGPVALLLHGWPYDIHSFADVAPLLAARGYSVLVP